MGNTKVLAIAPLLLAMYGCSSSSDSGTTTTTPTVTASTGLFLDAEVEGLSYTTDSGISGTTDENGTYSFLPGENVNFSVGGVDLGTVAGAPVCTPFDFAAASTNIARFLQSLDADGDPTNGIDIVDANTALAGTTISADAFLVDTATFEANTAITGAITDGGGTLISEAAALANLAAGTDNTFDPTELSDQLFVVLDPTNLDIGLMSFDPLVNNSGDVSSIFPEDTISGGGDGSGFDETWTINGEGQLVLTDPVEGFTTIVNRIGGSTRSITVTYSEDGAAALPATLLIPQTVTAEGLGGDGSTIISKTYDVIDADGSTPFEVVFKSDGSFQVNDGTGDSGLYTIGDVAPNVITISDSASPVIGDNLTFLIMLDTAPAVVDDTASMMIVDTTITGFTNSDPDLEFDAIGVGSVTLTGTTPAP
jgi:hypothetical protein